MSKIEWTECTWQVTHGCTEKSSGCSFCYARTMAKRLRAMALADIKRGSEPKKTGNYLDVITDDGKWTGIVKPCPDALTDPLGWKKPRKIFVDSMSDLFWGTDADLEDARRRGVKDPQPIPFDFIDKVFAIMALTRQHIYQILTKRPERMVKYLSRSFRALREFNVAAREVFGEGIAVIPTQRHGMESRLWPLPNVWLGTSCEDQATADERIPHLLRCPAAIRFISAEPLLGEIDLDANRMGVGPWRDELWLGVDWVIVGGESGGGARPCDILHIKSIVKQCKDAGVACFVKQLGAIVRDVDTDGTIVDVRMKSPKGGDIQEWPTDLQVREFPTGVEK